MSRRSLPPVRPPHVAGVLPTARSQDIGRDGPSSHSATACSPGPFHRSTTFAPDDGARMHRLRQPLSGARTSGPMSGSSTSSHPRCRAPGPVVAPGRPLHGPAEQGGVHRLWCGSQGRPEIDANSSARGRPAQRSGARRSIISCCGARAGWLKFCHLKSTGRGQWEMRSRQMRTGKNEDGCVITRDRP